MIVGRNPGKNEDEQGRPFVGLAGELLNKILGAAQYSRSQFFIDNIVACRSMNDAPPTEQEVEACWWWLRQEIELVRPEKIIALGALAIKRLTGVELKVTKAVGKIMQYGDLFSHRCQMLCLPHPAYYLRAGVNDVSSEPVQELVGAIRSFL